MFSFFFFVRLKRISTFTVKARNALAQALYHNMPLNCYECSKYHFQNEITLKQGVVY